MLMNISSFEIIKEKQQWQDVLKTVKTYDFYHTYDYHQLAKSKNDTPILITYREGDCIIGLPVLLREIYETGYYDITSVYGYTGPVMKNIDQNFINETFKKQLISFFTNNKIVSVFSRLHPFIAFQEKAINGLGEVLKLSKIVNIDLTKSLDEQKAVFSKTTKRYIKKTRKLCSVKIGGASSDINTFIDLYYENMDRVQAKKSYYFDKEYFEKFIGSEDFETDVLFAIHEETSEIISAAMMVKSNNIIQYHISGTRNNYLDLTPIRVLIDEMRIRGTQQGYKYFNLGGGLGSSEDSLFNFKASFSKDFKDFEIWKYIIDPEKYNQLVEQFSDKTKNENFFPLYRNNS